MKSFTSLVHVILRTVNDNRSILPRIIVGLIFLSEGIQKFLFPELVGTGRFVKIGLEHAEFLAYFVATFEITCGILLLIGFLIRLASIPLIFIMVAAIVTTKVPKLLNDGFWTMAHDSRTDFAMTLLLIFLIIFGADKLSIDYKLDKLIFI